MDFPGYKSGDPCEAGTNRVKRSVFAPSGRRVNHQVCIGGYFNGERENYAGMKNIPAKDDTSFSFSSMSRMVHSTLRRKSP
jgi:hypothetical protein